jgi:hypothetical protein
MYLYFHLPLSLPGLVPSTLPLPVLVPLPVPVHVCVPNNKRYSCLSGRQILAQHPLQVLHSLRVAAHVEHVGEYGLRDFPATQSVLAIRCQTRKQRTEGCPRG